MIDTMTRKPLRVLNGGAAGPYMILPASQLDEIQRFLKEHGVRYTVDDEFVSLNGAPETAVVDFGRGADRESIQSLLDGA